MKMTFKEFCETISDDDMVEVINDHVLFKQKGQIGNCKMRDLATSYLKILSGDNWSFDSSWMNMLAHEAYVRFANRYIKGM